MQYRPVKNGYLYLGYYYGDKKYLQDSAALQPDGTVTFRGDKLLTGGLYILVDDQKQRFTDLLIDQEQNFEVRLDTSAFTIQSITGSVENAYLENYKKLPQSLQQISAMAAGTGTG